MGMFDFVKDAGERLFGGGKKDAPASTPREPVITADERAMGNALTSLVQSADIDGEGLAVVFDDGRATLNGRVSSQGDCEKLVLLVGNTQGVSQVADHLKIDKSLAKEEPKEEPKSVFYTVKSGDSLSKIAQAHYGAANKYMAIFEANKPMLKNPDKIYPGQTLRIPKID